MIVYGWNTYRLKSVSPYELGLPANDQSIAKIEYRQKYFHLFFIPCFPIGRFWAVRQGGKLYHVSAEVEQALYNTKSAGKHWVWAWSGPLLALAVWFFISISDKMEEKAYRAENNRQQTMLAAFFKDTNKTAPLKHKVDSMYSLINRSFNSVKFEDKAIDTSQDNLLSLYLLAGLTHMDTLTGYDQKNTLVISIFQRKADKKQIISEGCQNSLDAGDWKGLYGDTSSVFGELRKLENYKYVLLLKEYNRIEPQIYTGGYNSGYSFVKGMLLSIDTRKELKNFKIMAANSEKVSHYSFSSSKTRTSPSSSEWRYTLDNDLNQMFSSKQISMCLGMRWCIDKFIKDCRLKKGLITEALFFIFLSSCQAKYLIIEPVIMGFFSKLFGSKQKDQSENGDTAKAELVTHSGLPDFAFYQNLVDIIAVSKELQVELKAKLKQAFDNPQSFYDDAGEYTLAERGLTYSNYKNLTPKFVLVDKMIAAGQMIEVDWKEGEEEVRHWIISIAKKKGFQLPLSTTKKQYSSDTFETIISIDEQELEPMGYCLEILDINSDSYVFTIAPLNKKQSIRDMFRQLK